MPVWVFVVLLPSRPPRPFPAPSLTIRSSPRSAIKPQALALCHGGLHLIFTRIWCARVKKAPKAMNMQWRQQPEAGSAAESPPGARRLSEARKGDRGVVVEVSTQTMSMTSGAAEREELERRLLEIGFVEGARVEILHEGFLGRDPIAVRLDDMRVALRRREAQGVLIRLAE